MSTLGAAFHRLVERPLLGAVRRVREPRRVAAVAR